MMNWEGCEKVVVAYLKVFSQHLAGWTEENHRKPQSGI
jgi:hypothetical protein